MKNKTAVCTTFVAISLLVSGCGNSFTAPPLESTGVKIPEITLDEQEIPENDALTFVKDMKIGWSLGNTLDATGAQAYELLSESSWCGIKTTEEMILSIKSAGFNTIRIPVSWHDHVDEDFSISKIWIDRVQEVVDYAYKNGMYVILNMHHDTELNFCYPTYEKLEQSKKYVEKIWQQLSERFADYDSHLIYEGLNEPRLKGTSNEWWVDASSDAGKEAFDCINQLNQLFVDTVRATGGTNAERYLMVPAYCAAVDFACSDSFVLPTDAADNKIIVSIHAYTPYGFALQADGDTGSKNTFDAASPQSTFEITKLMTKIYEKFVSKGIPAVIGEFGARSKDNLDARAQFAAYYIAAARSYGITCCWWDNNAVSKGEAFGIFNRTELKWDFPDIVIAMMKYC